MADAMRLIDANALIDYLKKLDFEGGTKTRNQAGNEVLHIHMPQVIRQAPAVDAVEVVRCKACHWWRKINQKKTDAGYAVTKCFRLMIARLTL